MLSCISVQGQFKIKEIIICVNLNTPIKRITLYLIVIFIVIVILVVIITIYFFFYFCTLETLYNFNQTIPLIACNIIIFIIKYEAKSFLPNHKSKLLINRLTCHN